MSKDWLPPRSPTPSPAPGSGPGWHPPAGAAPPDRPAFEAGPQHPLHGPGAPPPGGKETGATLALILGGLALALLVLTAGILFFLTVPVSVAAWIMGAKYRKSEPGAGKGRAAMWLGIVGVALGVLAGIAWTVLIAVDEGILDDIERELEELEEESRDNDDGPDEPRRQDDTPRDGTFVRLGVGLAVRVIGLWS